MMQIAGYGDIVLDSDDDTSADDDDAADDDTADDADDDKSCSSYSANTDQKLK